LPNKIEKLELKLGKINAEISEPDFYKQDHDVTSAKLNELKSSEQALSDCVDRWAELEQLAARVTAPSD